ncbi:hypothetical protein AB0B12_34925 [Streptomyces sp. NPDC044780]|uniref:hypothetical protein n=1 Tax=unclassified Streptomyces TaxID=2593676 RepID=UPI0033D51E74
MVGIVRTAAVIVLAAASGMRSSELMELEVGCCRSEESAPGLIRYRLVSKVIKGQGLGGVIDEWVVIEPAYRAAELIECLHPDPVEGASLLGRFAFDIRYRWFRNWINSEAGARLGLAPIPDGLVNLWRLRRTLALEMAYRPGGVLATKIHLKHIVVATTEGYSSRPGGAQAELLAEVNKLEGDRNLDLVLAEFRNYHPGVRAERGGQVVRPDAEGDPGGERGDRVVGVVGARDGGRGHLAEQIAHRVTPQGRLVGPRAGLTARLSPPVRHGPLRP